MPKRGKWVVESKVELIEDIKNWKKLIKEYALMNECEISIIREDNEYGKDSYGGGSFENKLIILDHAAYEDETDAFKKLVKEAQERATLFCNALNSWEDN